MIDVCAFLGAMQAAALPQTPLNGQRPDTDWGGESFLSYYNRAAGKQPGIPPDTGGANGPIFWESQTIRQYTVFKMGLKAPDITELDTQTQAGSLEETDMEEIAESAAAQTVIAAIITKPQQNTLPEEPAPDMEVNGVVFPAGLKVQEELRDLFAQIMGMEDSDGFSVIWINILPKEAMINSPEDFGVLVSEITQKLFDLPSDFAEMLEAFAQAMGKAQTGAEGAEGSAFQQTRQFVSIMFLQLNVTDVKVTQSTPETTVTPEIPVGDIAPPDEGVSAQTPEIPVEAEAPDSQMAESAAQTSEAPPPEIEVPVQEAQTKQTEASAESAQETPAPSAETQMAEAANTAETANNAESETGGEGTQGKTVKVTKKTDATAINTAQDAFTRVSDIKPPQEAQQPQAAQRTQAAAIIDQITAFVSQRSGEAVTRLEMQLNPATLGKISLVLEQTGEGLTAAIKSANGNVREILAVHMAELQSALKDAGINMRELRIEQPEIAWDFTRGDFNRGSGNSGGREGGRESRRAARVSSGSAMPESNMAALLYGTSALQPEADEDALLDIRA
ncbi:MAG: flagellar hook-length control protein FliK [Oscillospiraceae bacterium]|jgi:flagellar hook-length control protein FliK|nr:flagellar hook-length control protein FliK [Oscillospiraceae bacterium]